MDYNYPMSDENGLSKRELDILRLVATGASNKEIAQQLVISPNTVKVHLRNIFAKIGVASRTEATLYALKIGLISGLPVNPVQEDSSEEQAAESPSKPVAELHLPGREAANPPDRSKSRQIAAWIIFSIIALLTGGLVFRQWWLNSQVPTATATIDPAMTAINRWSSASDLPLPCKGLAVSTYERVAYLVCGETSDGITGRMFEYDPSTDAWTEKAQKPTPVSNIQAALVGERIYVPGGMLPNGIPSNLLEVYDPRQDAWEVLAPLPQPRSSYALAELEGRLYLFGGWDGARVVDTVYEYDPQENRWLERSPLPSPRSQASAVAVGSKIFVLGGTDGVQGLTNNDVYFPQRDQDGEPAWEINASLPEGRYGMSSATLVGAIYLYGGRTSQSTMAPVNLLQYAPDQDLWIVADQTNQQPTTSLAMLAWQTQIHLLGGALQDNTASRQHLVYQAVYTIQVPLIIR